MFEWLDRSAYLGELHCLERDGDRARHRQRRVHLGHGLAHGAPSSGKRARQIGLLLALVFRVIMLARHCLAHASRPRRSSSSAARLLLARSRAHRRRPVPHLEGAPSRCIRTSRESTRSSAGLARRRQLRPRPSSRSPSSISCSRSTRSSPPIGMADHIDVMIAAVIVAIAVMYFASGAGRRLHRAASDDQDAGAVVPAADRRWR